MTSARTTTVIGFMLLVNAILLSVPALHMPDLDPACAFQKAILCAELPRDGAELQAVLSDPVNPLPRWRRQIYLDMPFFVLYFALVAFTALRDGARLDGCLSGTSAERVSDSQPALGRRYRYLALVAAGLMGIGALLDGVENMGILYSIAGIEAGHRVSDGAAAWVRVASLGKFVLLCAGSAVGLSLAWRDAPWIGRVPLALGMLASALIPLGLVWPVFVEVGALGIAVACFSAWIRSGLALRRASLGDPSP